MPYPVPPTRLQVSAQKGRALAAAVLLAGVGWLSVAAQTSPDLEKLRARAEQADVDAQNTLGNAYNEGRSGLKQDYAEAVKWFRAAADKGFAPAQYNLGVAYELGHGVPADEQQAFKYYLMAAGQGFAGAQFNVGNMYAAGRGVGQDLFEANLWFKQAAEKGVVEAQFNLGLAYEAGRGLRKDEAQAARYYKQAADRGFARAQYNLGLLLEDGRGVTKSEAAAATYYRAAAEQGFAAAQNNYGLMLSEGRGGLAKDPVQAFVWLSLAAENGANPAARDFLGKSLDTGQRSAAAKQLADRKAGKVPAAVVASAPARPAPAPFDSSPPPRVAELTAALEQAKEANTQFAEANQRLELEKARLEQQIAGGGSDSSGLIEQLRAQSARLAGQVQSLTADKETAEREAALLKTQVKDAQQDLARAKVAPATTPAPDGGAAEKQIKDLTAKLAQATGSLAQLQAANQQLTEGNARLQQEKAAQTASAPKEGAPAMSGDNANILANLQRDNARLNDEVKRSTRELLSVNSQLRQLRNQPAKPAGPAAPGAEDKSAEQIAQLTAKLEQATQESLRAQTEISRLSAHVAELEKAPQPAANNPAVAQLQQQVAALQAEKADLEKWSHSLEQTVNEKSALADGANSGVADLKAKLAQVQKQLDDSQAENRTLAARTPAKPDTSALDDLRKQLAAEHTNSIQAQARVTALERDLRSAQKPAANPAELEDLKSQLIASNQLLEKNTAAMAALREENSRLTKAAATKPAANPAEIASLKKQLADASQSLERSNAAVAELTGTNERLGKDLAAAQQAAAVKPDTSAADALQQQVAKLTQEKQTISDKVTAEHANYIQAQARVAALERDVRTAQKPATNPTEVADLKKQLAEANQSLERSNATVAELTGANERLGKDLATAQQAPAPKPDTSAADALQQQVANLTQEKQAITDKVAAEHASYIQAQARVSALERDLRGAQKPAANPAELADLKKQLAEANEALEKSSATVAELTGANDRLEKDLATAKQGSADAGPRREELTKLRADAAAVVALRAENARLTKAAGELNDLRAKNDQLAKDAEQATAFMNSNRRDLNAAQARVTELEKQLADSTTVRTRGGDDTRKQAAELADANATVEKLNATVAELTGANDRLEKDLDSARKSTAAALAAQSQAVTAAQPDAYKMEIGTLQAHVKELEGQIEDERNNSAKEVSTLATQLSRTRETNKSLTEANRALMSAKQSDAPTVDKGEFDALQQRVRDLAAAGDELKRQNEKLAKDNQGLTGERAALQQQLVDTRKAVTLLPGLSDEKAALQERLEAVGAQLVKAQQDVDTLQKENAEATSQVLASKQAADKAQADLAALQGRTTEAEKASESHNTAVAELTGANGKLETERNDLRRQLASLRAENSRLTQSTGNLEQLKADADRSAQQNIAALTAQLNQLQRDLQSARGANSQLVEGNVAQERDRVAVITQLRNENNALVARLTQAQGTLDQIASAARLGTPAATIAGGGTPLRPVATSAPAAPEARVHTVTEGDSLSRISMRYYGTPNRWQEIYNANRDVLQASSTLRVGMQLRIP